MKIESLLIKIFQKRRHTNRRKRVATGFTNGFIATLIASPRTAPVSDARPASLKSGCRNRSQNSWRIFSAETMAKNVIFSASTLAIQGCINQGLSLVQVFPPAFFV